MKKAKLILFLIIIIFCYLWISDSYGQYLPREVETVIAIVRNCKLVYIPEPEREDRWQTPRETEIRGGGDCEDLSVWLLYELRKLGYKCWIVFGTNLQGKRHCWVRFKTLEGLYDADMQTRTVRNGWQEIKPSLYEFNKLKEVEERQKE